MHKKKKKEEARQYAKGDHVTMVVHGKRRDGAVSRMIVDNHLGTYYEVDVDGELVSRYGPELRPAE